MRRPFSIETLRAANPGIGYTVTEDYLRGSVGGEQQPRELNRYLRLHIRKTDEADDRVVDPMSKWDAAGGMVRAGDFAYSDRLPRLRSLGDDGLHRRRVDRTVRGRGRPLDRARLSRVGVLLDPGGTRSTSWNE